VTSPRESWPKRIRDVMDGRPVRWADAPNLVGDYDGRERTLEVFDADAKDQRLLLRRLRPIREELEQAAGGPVLVIFHTSLESARLYGDFVRAALRAEATDDVATCDYDLPDDVPPLAMDVELKERDGARTGTGSTELPRVAA
jgi:hypothetical protein